MARETQGSCKSRLLADDSRAFDLRFQVNGERESVVLHERPGCTCGCGGGWDEAGARTELGNILALVRVGMWERPEPPAALAEFGEEAAVPLFREYAPWWLEQKIAGVIGDRRISENTTADYRNRLRHLTGFFGPYPLDEIDADLCLEFKAHLLLESQEQREALDAGADLRDRYGRPVRPLGPSMIHQLIAGLRAILDEAVEDRHIDYNPARGRRMKVKVPKPKRTFLEMDELAYLVDAAAEQDAAMLTSAAPEGAGRSATAVASLATKGLSAKQIAKELGLAKSSVTYHLRRLGADIGRGYVGRRVICEMLGRGGPRVSELCDIKIGDVRVHDPEGARFRIPDAKTEAGERVVEMSPVLVEVVVEHLDRLRRLGMPTGPEDYLVPNLRGGRMTRKRIGQIVREAAQLASKRLAEKGLPPLPHTTPHTLRRTYISIALLANNFDVKWVMGQVGHADSSMTMDVYAQMEKRAKRSHGKSFDRLVREAREQVKGLPAAMPEEEPRGDAAAPKKRRVRSKRR
jgi:integrase